MKYFLVLGSLNALIAVGLGAFGAHGLKARVTSEYLGVWNTAVQYHLFHALGLVLVSVLAHLFSDQPLIRISGWALMAGILLFSGSLYLLVLSGVRSLGMITPLGGIAFIAGWGLLAAAGWKLGL